MRRSTICAYQFDRGSCLARFADSTFELSAGSPKDIGVQSRWHLNVKKKYLDGDTNKHNNVVMSTGKLIIKLRQVLQYSTVKEY